MKRLIIATGLLAAWFSGATAGTLDTVKQRGTLVCGVSAGFAGFSTPDSQGNYKGLDVDYCRALAAGVVNPYPQPMENTMKRITLAALASAAVLFAGTAVAQQNIDFAKVKIKTTDLGNKTYMLERRRQHHRRCRH